MAAITKPYNHIIQRFARWNALLYSGVFMDWLIHITTTKFYEFEGWKFEYDRHKPISPWPLKKDLEPRARAGYKFYDMFFRFQLLTIEEQEKLRI